MKIIIEGCDGVGKTTLAQRLADMFNLQYSHDSCPRTFKEYQVEMLNGIPRVYDRFFFGQFAGYQTSKERILSIEELKELLNLAKEKGIIILLCYDKVENILKRFKHNEDDKIWMEKTGYASPEEFIQHIQEGFLKIAELGGDYINYICMEDVIKYDNKK